MSFLPPPPKTGPLLAAALLILLAFSEWFARRHHSHPEIALAFERGPYHRVLIIDPPKGVKGPARVSTDRWGMRGDDPPSSNAWVTWIAVGSSTTLCPNLDDAAAWPARLQAYLRLREPRTWVGNAGEDGLTAASLIKMLDRVIRTAAPQGVVILPGGPDLVMDLYDDRRDRPNPYDAAFERRLARLRGPFPWKTRFGLWRAREDRRHKLDPRPPIPDSSGHKYWSPPRLTAPEDPLPAFDTLLISLPDYRANLHRLGALARELGIRAVFLTHPIAYGTDSAWQGLEARTVRVQGCDYRISAATERRLRDAFNDALLEVCAADSLECLDLARQIPPDPRYYYDGSHFNDAGADTAAALIAAQLLKSPKSP